MSFGWEILWKFQSENNQYLGGETVLQYLEYLETHVINKCNLNCKGCSHFSNIVEDEDSVVELEVFERDFKRLRELFDHIFMIRLMGGEPFLNENLEKYVEIVRKYFPKSDLRILTNGILIPKVGDQLLNQLSIKGVKIDISCYKPTNDLRKEIENRLQMFGIEFDFSEVINTFHRRLNLSGDNDKQEMYSCCPSNICTFIHDGKMAVCPAPFMSKFLNKRFNTSVYVESDLLDLNQPNITAEIVKKYLKTPMKSCGFCSMPEDFKWQCGTKPVLEDWLIEKSMRRSTDV